MFRVQQLAVMLLSCLTAWKLKPAKKGGSASSKPASSGSSSTAKPAASSGIDMTKLGSVKGKAVFKGAAPAMEALDTSKDSWCKEHAAPKKETFVVDANGGLRDVVCYIEGMDAHASKFPEPDAPARLEQKGCQYVPHVLCIRTGQELEVVNGDNTSHNYHFTGRANDEINKTQANQGDKALLVFDNAESDAYFRCDIHPWMQCNIKIFEHPCFAVSAADGSFSISGIPAGSWKLRLEHANAKTTMATVDVTVTANGTADVGTIEFTQ